MTNQLGQPAISISRGDMKLDPTLVLAIACIVLGAITMIFLIVFLTLH